MLALAVAWVLFVPAADWLAHHDVGSVTGPLHETALDNARGRLLTLGAGLFAAGALIFTAQNFILSRRAAELSRRTFELTQQGQVTDRFTKAIEQLGSDKLDVRIGGIYALERVASDSARDHPTVIEVLTAFIREHSREPWSPPDPDGRAAKRSMRPDVEAALTVVRRRDHERDIRYIDLHWAAIYRANLIGAHLTGAVLNVAHLNECFLTGADLTAAYLNFADLTDAELSFADLTGADLQGTNLTRAKLTRANLTEANLTDANLTGANLTEANLMRVDLTGADLTDARLASAKLDGALWPRDAAVPDGWALDTGSGRLNTAGSWPVTAN